MQHNHHQIQHAGFWRRFAAFCLDLLMVSTISTLLAIMLLGSETLISAQQAALSGDLDWRLLALEHGLPIVWAIGFWMLWMATPGKLLMDCYIVDAIHRGRASNKQLILRYLGYILSTLPLGLGFLWILFDRRKQGWHDKLAGTLVIMQDASLQPLEAHS